jgi:hypothetical protein
VETATSSSTQRRFFELPLLAWLFAGTGLSPGKPEHLIEAERRDCLPLFPEKVIFPEEVDGNPAEEETPHKPLTSLPNP